MYKLLAIVLSASLAAVWHSRIAGLLLVAVVLAVFLISVFQVTDGRRSS